MALTHMHMDLHALDTLATWKQQHNKDTHNTVRGTAGWSKSPE